MLAKINAFALVGIDAVPVEAEVDVSQGLRKTVRLRPATGPFSIWQKKTGLGETRREAV
jgi:hypothetical protein